jgi:Chaperone of endosialidase
LVGNTTGNDNTASGYLAFYQNTIGNNNVALGNLAGSNLTSGSNNIDIGNEGVPEESGIIRIGTNGTHTSTFVAGIRGVPVSGGMPVAVNANGQFGVRPSSSRFKAAIRPMNDASEAIFELQPVTFRYKLDHGSEDAPQFGLVAEKVERVNRDLVVHDETGKPFTVRYDAVNAMLLNEFLKAHSQLEEFASIIQEQQQEIRALMKTLKEQAAQLQRVSERVDLIRTTPRLIANE